MVLNPTICLNPKPWNYPFYHGTSSSVEATSSGKGVKVYTSFSFSKGKSPTHIMMMMRKEEEEEEVVVSCLESSIECIPLIMHTFHTFMHELWWW
jgi:hypothetical protein